MTALMSALPVILAQPTCPGDQRAKDVLFQSTCNLCRESHKTQVWLCFLILSFLSPFTCAASVPDVTEVKICLNRLKPAIEESCKITSLRCYMLELIMVAGEEEIMNNDTECIMDFNDTLPTVESVVCPPCEAYSLENITIFLERLNTLLENMATLANT
uniref:Interleukin-15 n=1 Tax=Dicentrarchus labrax TaxID=13489 RepID=A0A8P4KGF0_DICLA